MQCTFEHLSGSKKGQLEQAQGERITVGRDPANTVSFDPQQDLDVSSHHAQLAVGDEGKYMLTDLGSRNGTFLNGQKVAGTVVAEPGSKIQFGKGGPEVKIAYTPGAKKPGATRVLLAQVQQSLEDEKTKAAQGKKTTLIAAAIAGVLVLGGGTTYFLVSAHSAKKEKAHVAQTACLELSDKAKKKNANTLAPVDFQKAADAEAAADELEKKGDYLAAADKYNEARKGYDDSIEEANAASLKAQRAEMDAERKAAADAQQAQAAKQLEEMAQQQNELKEKMAAADEETRKAKADLANQMALANDAQKQALQKLADTLKKKPDSAIAREILATGNSQICYIKVESYVQPAGAKDRTVIGGAEGTGFVIAPDMISAAKHVLQPWKYDPQLSAKAKKIKEVQGLEVKDYVEVWTWDGKTYTKKYDSVAGSCKILKTADDKFVAQAQTVEIKWNMQPMQVQGVQLHERNTNDYAIIQVPGGKLAPVNSGDKGPENYDNVLILGVALDNKALTANEAIGTVQAKGETSFNVNATVPATYAGAPVYRYDKQVWGIVAGTEVNNAVCVPIDRVLGLTK